MYLTSKLFQNQIHFYDNINTINSNANLINLDISTYTNFIINLTKNYSNIHIESLDNTFNNYYFELFIICHNDTDNSINFNFPDVIWSDKYYDDYNNNFILDSDKRLYVTLFTFNSGKDWFGDIIGFYSYDELSAVIETPKIIYPKNNSKVQYNHITIQTDTFKSYPNKSTQTQTLFKICSDIEGEDIIYTDNYDENNDPDFYHHTFNYVFDLDTDYYLFAQFTSANFISEWSNPVKVTAVDSEPNNPTNWDFSSFSVIDNIYRSQRYYIYHSSSLNSATENGNILNILDKNEENHIINISDHNNYLIIYGLHGFLTQVDIKYSIDYLDESSDLPFDYHIADEIDLYVDNSNTPIWGWRPIRINDTKYIFPYHFDDIYIENQIKIVFKYYDYVTPELMKIYFKFLNDPESETEETGE